MKIKQGKRKNLKTFILKCRECGRTERTHSLEMLPWAEAECCGEGCMEVNRADQA